MELIGGFGAAFLGAVIGVVGQAWWTRRHDDARLRAELKAAARLVRAELQLAAASCVSATTQDSFIPLEAFNGEAWRTHGVSLANLRSDDFDAVAEACTKMIAAGGQARLVGGLQRHALAMSPPKPSKVGDSAESLQALLGLCDRAIQILGPIAYPGESLRPWPPADRFKPDAG